MKNLGNLENIYDNNLILNFLIIGCKNKVIKRINFLFKSRKPVIKNEKFSIKIDRSIFPNK